MKYTVIIRKEHCQNNRYIDCYDCGLARAIKEQLPKLEFIGIGGGFVKMKDHKDWFFDNSLNGWQSDAFCKLKTGEINEVVVTFQSPDHKEPEISKTTLHMGGGFHSFITWNEDKGIDQHGRAWVNQSDPRLENKVQQKVFDNCLQDALTELNKAVFDKPESHNDRVNREDRQQQILEGAREDFALNWKEGK